MYRTLVPALFVALSACAAGTPSAPGPSATVTGSLERVGASSDWVGVETVDLTDDAGSCALVRTILARESASACPGCEIQLEAVDSVVEAEIDDCRADLGDLPTLDPTVGFVLSDASQASGSGSLVVSQGENWRSYANGVFSADVGVLTWHHRIRLDAVDPWSFDPDEDIRDRPTHEGLDSPTGQR